MTQRGTEDDGTGGPPRRQSGALVVLVAVALLVYAADVISKVVVVATLTENEPVRVAGSLLQLDYLRNPGAAFSLGRGSSVIIETIAVVIVVASLVSKLSNSHGERGAPL